MNSNLSACSPSMLVIYSFAPHIITCLCVVCIQCCWLHHALYQTSDLSSGPQLVQNLADLVGVAWWGGGYVQCLWIRYNTRSFNNDPIRQVTGSALISLPLSLSLSLSFRNRRDYIGIHVLVKLNKIVTVNTDVNTCTFLLIKGNILCVSLVNKQTLLHYRPKTNKLSSITGSNAVHTHSVNNWLSPMYVQSYKYQTIQTSCEQLMWFLCSAYSNVDITCILSLCSILWVKAGILG